jgi:hypothetical protein
VFIGSLIGLHPTTAQGVDNGFARGISYRYSGSGYSDFNFYFTNNGFTSSNGRPMQIVLTASQQDLGFQVSIWIYNSTYVLLDNEVWDISTVPPTNLWQDQHQVSGIINSYHTIKLQIYSSGNWYVGFYLDATRYDSYQVPASTFDKKMTPSLVIESLDNVTNDWNGKYITGIFRTGSTSLHTQYYGGRWGYDIAGCVAYQDSTVYVGETVGAPANVGTTGSNLGLSYTGYLNRIGHTAGFDTLDDFDVWYEYYTWAANPTAIKVS